MTDLIGDDISRAFSAHSGLSPVTVKELRLQYDDYLGAGDVRRATELARLSASDVAGRLAAELNKRKRKNNREYFRPTVLAELWRDKHTRRELRCIVQDHPQRQRFLAGFRMTAHDELWMRAYLLAKLLIEQVELAAQPLRPQEVDRLIENALQRVANLRRAGVSVLPWLWVQRAVQHARDHEREFRTEAEREDAMIRAATKRLALNFAMRGDRLVAGLVETALGRAISPRRVRHVSIGR
jgi:hypothetical protein